MNLIAGCDGDGFSLDSSLIHYGGNSGFQAVNMALHFLDFVARPARIVLVGFDMRMVEGRRHFFGDHPAPLRQTSGGYRRWPEEFHRAAAALPKSIEIVNCTPGSAITCFPQMPLEEALRGSDVAA